MWDTNKTYRYRWLKGVSLKNNFQKLFWSLSKKDIPQAVIRNRLKRWGRENMKKASCKTSFLFVFLSQKKGFYENLRRKDFDAVFNEVLGKHKENSV